MATLGPISRTQLTVLGIVSHNDYNKNVYGLGCATNFSIIKSLSDSNIPTMVADYLADPQVVIKNKNRLDFDASIRVFTHGQQIPIPRQESNLCALTSDKIKAKFDNAKELLAQRKKAESEAKLSAKRHKASQTFNWYRVIDRPPPQDKKPIGNRTTTDVVQQEQPAPPAPYRPRYSLKSHTRKSHEPPSAMKQHKLKPWKNKSETPDETPTAPVTDVPKAPRRGPRLPSIDQMTKAHLVKALAWEHPMATLDIGTLKANVKYALKVKDISRDPIELAEDSAVANETIDCVQAIVKEANRVKRKCQGLFGAYIERVDRDGATSNDKAFLKEICPPIPREMTEDAASNTLPSQDSTTLDDAEDTSDRQVQFIGCFMRYLYSNNYPRNTGIGIVVNRFIERLEQMKLHKSVRIRDSIDKKPEFSSSELVRSASVQLAVEMKKIYWHGSVQLLEQLRTQFERDKKQNPPNIRADEDKNPNARKDVDAPKDADAVGDSSNAEHTAAHEDKSTVGDRDMDTAPNKDMDTAPNKDMDTAPNKDMDTAPNKDMDTAPNEDKDIITNKDKDGNNTQSSGFTLSIYNNLSAVENFLTLNKLVKNPRRIVPISPRVHGFLSFSERELLVLFCGRQLLQDRIRLWADHTFSTKPSIDNLKNIWLDTVEPGFLIKSLLTDVGPKNLSARKRGKAGYRGAIKLTSMDEIRDHLRPFREGNLVPNEYGSKGYALRGSIRTDGFRLQLLSFKLKELQSVRFKRLPEVALPPRLTSTIGGTDYFLPEIRNVIKTPADVSRHWPSCKPENISILCLDLGQAFVCGASVLLPDSSRTAVSAPPNPLPATPSTTLIAPIASTSTPSSAPARLASADSPSNTSDDQQIFHNVAVSQKAVSQPTLKHRRWMQGQKKVVPQGAEQSISELESGLPPLRGEGVSVVEYMEELAQVQDRLDDFYNGNNQLYKRHGWDARRAKEEEFKTVANRLLNAVGGSVGRKREDDDMVVIGIGLGQFKSNSGLSSLHGPWDTLSWA
ncbi:hypothetical protein EC957_001748 [Mortierella hygrophila]|uniref:Uncharacterized protein n=1 Tax=Mortierella hygrophila TaxID=979708 RepID=A0A9P6F576_9FUNG|nr:hypothetical protein EC957_001748 [Mortierella hygrophila]